MSGGQGKKWIIKNAEGLLKGPYSTEDVLKKISRGDYSGDELISEYPGASWYPISQDPHFYDRLLDVLSRQAQSEEEQIPLLSQQPDSKPSQPEEPSKTAELDNEELELEEPDQKAQKPHDEWSEVKKVKAEARLPQKAGSKKERTK